MYVTEQVFKELTISDPVNNFLTLIKEHPDRFEFGWGVSGGRTIRDHMTGMYGSVFYKAVYAGEVEGWGIMGLEFVNALEAREIFIAISEGIEVKACKRKEDVFVQFQNAYQKPQDQS